MAPTVVLPKSRDCDARFIKRKDEYGLVKPTYRRNPEPCGAGSFEHLHYTDSAVSAADLLGVFEIGSRLPAEQQANGIEVRF